MVVVVVVVNARPFCQRTQLCLLRQGILGLIVRN